MKDSLTAMVEFPTRTVLRGQFSSRRLHHWQERSITKGIMRMAVGLLFLALHGSSALAQTDDLRAPPIRPSGLRTRLAGTEILLSWKEASDPEQASGLTYDVGIGTAPGAGDIVSPPVCVQVPSGAVAWWRAESNMVDSIGISDGLSGAFSGFPSLLYMSGKVGVAFRFFSDIGGLGRYPSNNYITVTASADLNLGAHGGLTIEGWVKPDLTSGIQPIAEWNDGRGNIGAGLNLNGSAVEAFLTDTNVTPARQVVLRSLSGLIATSFWQHVALTLDQAVGMATIYLNGVVVAQTNLGAFVPQTLAPFYLAYRPSGTNSHSMYLGGMDEFTLHNRALSAAELQTIVAADEAGKCPPPPPSCVAPPSDFVGWWRGESNTLDSVDSNNGSTVSSVRYGNGSTDKAFEFVAGYVRIPASSNLNVGAGPGLTFEAWISPQSPNIELYSFFREFLGWHGGIITQGVSLGIIRLSPAPSAVLHWQANLVDPQGRSHMILSPAGLATLDVFQHVAVTYDKLTGEADLYFNGNLVTRINLGTFTPQTTGDLNFGYHSQSLPYLGISSGEKDEIGLYGRTLNAAEIKAIVKSRGAGKCKDPPSLTSQPANLRVNEGENAMFTVTAVGNPILKYQWRSGGTNLPGESAASLILTNVELAQAGLYSVRVTNAFGLAVSSNAFLTVNRPPVADASATVPLIIAPLHCSPVIVLDG